MMSVVPSETVEPARPTSVTYWETVVFDWIFELTTAGPAVAFLVGVTYAVSCP